MQQIIFLTHVHAAHVNKGMSLEKMDTVKYKKVPMGTSADHVFDYF